MKRLITILLTAILVLASSPSFAVDNGIGTSYMTVKDTPAKGLEYNEIYATNSAGKQIAYTYTYSHGSDTQLCIGTAHGIFGRESATQIAEYEASLAKNVIGSVNGNSFQLQSGVTNGTLISNGRLLSWDNENHNTLGLKKDGSTITGSPDISIKFTYGSKEYNISALNKWVANQSGITLLTDSFASSTKSTGSRLELVIKPAEADLSFINDTTICTVISVSKSSNTTIPKGCFVITLPTGHASSNSLANIKAGETLTVSANCSAWKDVTFATGTGERIINDGKALTSTDTKISARTVIGIKNNGNIIFFSCDGDGNHGKGMTTAQVSAELISMGVKEAYHLDDGSSVTVTKNGHELANHPSLGTERLIGSTILFVNTNTAKDTTALLITPTAPTVLKNGIVQLSCVPVDAGGNPTGDAITNLSYSLSSALGTVNGSTFKAGTATGSVTLTAKASCNGKTITGTTVLNIISDIDNITSEKATVYVPIGGKASLDIKGIRSSREVYIGASSLKWSLNGVSPTTTNGAVISCKYGYLDNNLIFHAAPGYSKGNFTLNAQYGKTSLPIKIVIGKPDSIITDFDDPSIAFSGYLKTSTSQSFRYSVGKFQTYGLAYSGTGITYKTPVIVDDSANELSLWLKGVPDAPYAIVELENGARRNVKYECSADYSAFDGWRKYTLALPENTTKILSPLYSDAGVNCVVDEITVSYGSPSPVFSDISSSWAKSEIEFLYYLDITTGYGTKENRTYKPQNHITRVEFAKMVVTYYKLNINDYKDVELNFRDTASIPRWALPYVRAAVAEGFISGSSNPDGSLSFLPKSNITRAQAATIIGRILTCAPVDISFSDKGDIPVYALNGLMKCVSASVLGGYPDGSFRPDGYLTRAEVAKIITNLYKYSYEK